MTLRFVEVHGGPSVVFESDALKSFGRFRQRRLWQREGGGQLFARFDGVHSHVEVATTPSRKDSRSRFGFTPDRPTQRAQIREFYERGLHFVGDWHSHPEQSPEPSAVDLMSVRECFQQSRHDLKSLLLVIVGKRAWPDGLWVGLVSRHAVRRLRVQSVDSQARSSLPSVGIHSETER
jgi:integrative and conjugative element protein (TIGR02256 family)